mgnify:CR=1 FL=1
MTRRNKCQVTTTKKLGEEMRGLLAEVLNVDFRELSDESILEDYPSWDSLTCLSLLTEVECKFDVELDPSALFRAETLGEMTEYVGKATGAASHPPNLEKP